jgi:hypothetical protein
MFRKHLTSGEEYEYPRRLFYRPGKIANQSEPILLLLRFPQVFNLPAREKMLARRDWVKVR